MSGNYIIKSNNLFTYECYRLQTYENKWCHAYNVCADDLAQNGFVYVGPRDKVRCVYCSRSLWKWEPGDSAQGEHQKFYPDCPFLRGYCENLNVPLQDTNTSVGLYKKTNGQESWTLSDYRVRIQSFNTWPSEFPVNREAAAAAGFYYTNLRNPAVMAVMFVCDISVEQMRNKLEEIIMTQGFDYTITRSDLTYLVDRVAFEE